MTLPVVPYAPKARARFYGPAGLLDVSDRDLLHVSTEAGVNNPTGKWSMRLTGRKVGGRGFIDRIAPMDYVEIELARVPSGGGQLTLAMRGFVDNVQETIGGSGSWDVSVNGRNFGKLLIQFQIYYLTEIDPAASLIPQARLEVNFGIPGGVLAPRQFVELINQQIISPNIAALREGNGQIPDLALAVDVPDRFGVNGFTVQPFTGSVWNLITQYASKPWIEVFVQDREAGPTLCYRFAPYTDWSGTPAAGFPCDVDVASVHPRDIEQISLGTSDNEVFTYYFTYPAYSLLDRIAFKGEGLDLSRNPFVDAAKFGRYGYRPFEQGTPLIPSLVGDAADLSAASNPDVIGLAGELNQWVVHNHQDNHRFLNGSMTIKGGGGIQPGMYVDLALLEKRLYVASVAHDFNIQAGTYKTTLAVTRGRAA